MFNNADTLGNLFGIGSKLEIKCSETNKSEIIHCLPGGLWSVNEFFCTSNLYSACENPSFLIEGKLGALNAFNETHVSVNASCNLGYNLLVYGNILCEISTGMWTGFESVCCVKLRIADWTKMYSYQPTDNTYSIKTLYKRLHTYEDINACANGIYQNEAIFDNWENEHIRYINFTVISGGTTVAYMLFNGLGTNNTSWFSFENLVQSSWYDLTPKSSVQVFSLHGLQESFRRWYVARNASEYASCTEDVVWFVVTWGFTYKCERLEGRRYKLAKIMYSNNGRASIFADGNFGLADKLEIWIQN
ncbi:uncharacterized protein LOC132747513 [Ruditapes philippinarum]|uniref:uncharacterized protein LOC132747513 n=1 Tax=Ruditapes philippinarum TaxID=129788 RepID=UPI00295B4F1E|nr:uncharacterized protein LOC132747513 [Ruditapes philippinarum]